MIIHIVIVMHTVQLVGSSLEEKRHNLALELLWIQQAIHSRKQVKLSSVLFFDVDYSRKLCCVDSDLVKAKGKLRQK